MFDTLSIAKELEAAGYNREQAEAQVKVIQKMVTANIATKKDLEGLQAATKQDLEIVRIDIESLRAVTQADIKNLRIDIESLREATQADIKNLQAATQADIKSLQAATRKDLEILESKMHSEFRSVRADMTQMENRMIIKLGAMMVGIASLVGFFL